ncbi:hypothetical protein QL285_035647 [Trifolium repens]|jgi:hypothetical protein|nr:hypothetical protein QL285_036496 [Trifolium repens]KAK2425400.1 hypothetical protein QL285_035647 [Trifolium repens]
MSAVGSPYHLIPSLPSTKILCGVVLAVEGCYPGSPSLRRRCLFVFSFCYGALLLVVVLRSLLFLVLQQFSGDIATLGWCFCFRIWIRSGVGASSEFWRSTSSDTVHQSKWCSSPPFLMWFKNGFYCWRGV